MYKISEVARLTKLSTATLRYYEAIGLLLPKRQENTYRTFEDDDLTWLTFIENMKKTGMKLSEIKNFSDLKQEGASTQNERLEMLAQQREELLQKCAELKQSLGFLEDTIELTKNC